MQTRYNGPNYLHYENVLHFKNRCKYKNTTVPQQLANSQQGDAHRLVGEDATSFLFWHIGVFIFAAFSKKQRVSPDGNGLGRCSVLAPVGHHTPVHAGCDNAATHRI